jgi:hypothetical protein
MGTNKTAQHKLGKLSIAENNPDLIVLISRSYIIQLVLMQSNFCGVFQNDVTLVNIRCQLLYCCQRKRSKVA